MKQIGISIYPEKASYEENLIYITKCSNLGFSRMFISLLEINGNQADIIANFKNIIHFAKEKGFEVIVDINPSIFTRLGISYSDLSFFSELGADGIRLDLGFSGSEEALMTHNPFGLKIEINMSHGTDYLESVVSRRPRPGYLIGSHNFYPHAYTGLSIDYFEKCCEKFRAQNIPTSAFITSQAATLGPWPLNEGICTIEAHRNLPVRTQAAHLLFSSLIDSVVIGNAFASDEELESIAALQNYTALPIRVKFNEATDLEKQIALEQVHIYRGEISDYVYRTKSDGRKRYVNQTIAPNNTISIKKGDILLDNDLYLQYKGELQIAKIDRNPDNKVNVIGSIVPEDMILLESLKPWSSFILVAY